MDSRDSMQKGANAAFVLVRLVTGVTNLNIQPNAGGHRITGMVWENASTDTKYASTTAFRGAASGDNLSTQASRSVYSKPNGLDDDQLLWHWRNQTQRIEL